ncbi:uncharacterized protein LOC131649814 [Vicia villosa]|uniref:uncharacterized protein LOC131649814 n=1 Tax=Vicia villosa TaxID=3911 RepID=UPI00273C0D4C|nr:uncharacterized protein LOC131649814 [Vicia villosa]
MVRLLEMATCYARSTPLSAEAARFLQEQVKMKASALEEKDQLLKEQGEELDIVKARLNKKEAALVDVQGQYTLLSRTLYGTMLSSSVREASLRRSQAPAEDESEEEKALLTRADLIQYIRVLGSDCVAAAEDTFHSTVAQLKLKNPGVELVTEGTGPYHRVEGDQIVSPAFGEEPVTQEAEEVQVEEGV